MQTSTQEPESPAPAAASTPAPAQAPASITTVGADGKEITIAVPRSIEEMQALESRQSELGNQLSSVTGRREELVIQLRSSPDGAARTGLEDRIKVLDARILQLERDLAITGQEIAAAPSDLARATRVASRAGSSGDDFEEGVAAGFFPTASLFIVMMVFFRWRRKRRGPKAPKVKDENAERMERLEQGMEAIAIEIERVSEGQRFVTKLLSEAPVLQNRQLAGVEKEGAR